MIRKIIQTSMSSLILISLSAPVYAGKLYRFPDEEGVPTISRTLPPAAAQKGYDILDDKSLRVLERVAPALTDEQIAEQERQIQLEKEKKRQAEIAEKLAQEQRAKQAIEDKNLLASYQTEQDLISARDTDIQQRQTLLEKTLEIKAKLEQDLINYQQQAADQELSGTPISKNSQKRLQATQTRLDNNTNLIEQLNSEIAELTKQYDGELVRLRELLQRRKQSH